jgi:hypothetical protein
MYVCIVGFLVCQKVSSRAPLMVAVSREDQGACKESTVAGTPAESPYSSLNDSRSTVASTGAERVCVVSPYDPNWIFGKPLL